MPGEHARLRNVSRRGEATPRSRIAISGPQTASPRSPRGLALTDAARPFLSFPYIPLSQESA